MLWPNVRAFLPRPPARVVEIGCGRDGGLVPALEADGYRALGIDPVAPEGPSYMQVEFERSEISASVHAFLACVSLHHVAQPAVVLDKVVNNLAADGVVVIVEWDWESFDRPTAEWCFDRLPAVQSEGWLERHRKRWMASGESWEQYLRRWAEQEGLHAGAALLRELDQRLERLHYGRGAYFFPDLPLTTEAAELQAISEKKIRPTRIDYVGRLSR